MRNVLYEVYGLSSSAYDHTGGQLLHADYDQHPIVKTHLPPDQLPEQYRHWPAVCLLRDGRDCLVSMAHHRKDIVAPGSNFYLNLLQAIIALNGSFFGGWSQNVLEWHRRGALIIDFADLIKDPIGQIEQMRELIELPSPQRDQLPTFESLKFGKPKYHATKKIANSNEKHFRRGKVGGWKDEMPAELHVLFWLYHGEAMRTFGFTDSEPAPLTEASRKALWQKISQKVLALHDELPPDAQGPILTALGAVKLKLQQGASQEVQVDAHFGYENVLLRLKSNLQSLLPRPIYRGLSKIYRQLPAREVLRWIKARVIRKSW